MSLYFLSPSSAVAAWTPLSLPGLVSWHDASRAGSLWQDSARTTLATADSDPVGAWDDLSPNGYHVLQGTAAARPTRKDAIQNGRAVVRTDGVDDYLSVALSDAQPIHYFVVARYNSASNNTIVDGAGNEMRLYRSTNDMNMYGGAGILATTTPQSFHVYGCLFNGASSKFRIDGASAATGDAGSSGITALVIGAQLLQSVFGGADIGELILCGAEVSGANLTAVESYLNAKWGVY